MGLLRSPAAAALMKQALPGFAMQLGGGVPASASGSSEPQPFAVRVREAQCERASFRRVVLADADAERSAKLVLTFAELETRVCSKFKSSRSSEGAEAGLRRLVALVRIRDSLEVADDEDASLLADGDELEATFASL